MTTTKPLWSAGADRQAVSLAGVQTCSRFPAHPPKRQQAAALQSGFTLIELLLSISIFAIVLVAANGILFGALRLRNKTTANLAKAVVLERVAGILRNDIAGVVVPNGKLSGDLQSDTEGLQTGRGRPVSPEFYTNTGLIDDRYPWAEVQKVVYYLRSPTNRLAAPGLDLVRSVTRNLLPPNQEESEDQPLIAGVQRITFSYYNGTAWQPTWNSTNETTVLPKAVKVEVLMAQADAASLAAVTKNVPSLELVVPILATADTNQTSGAQQ